MKSYKRINVLLLLIVATVLMGAKVASDSLKLGRKTAENITLEFDIGSANNPKILWNNGTGKLRFTNNGTTFFDLGSGSGGGGGSGVNLRLNPGFEEGNGDVTTYKDVAGVLPVDGTGGTPTLTQALTTTSGEVLRGLQSLKITKPASNTQGEGVALPVTIEELDKGKVLQLSFDFKTQSGYTSDDFRVYLIETAGPNVIAPIVFKIPSGTGTFKASVQARPQTSYRIVIHCATTSTAASSFIIDNVSIGPSVLPNVPALLSGIPFTPTGSWNTNTTYQGSYERHGKIGIFHYLITVSGAPNNVALNVNLPAGLTVDTTDPSMVNVADNYAYAYGSGTVWDSSTSASVWIQTLYSGGNVFTPLYYTTAGGAGDDVHVQNTVDATLPMAFASGDKVSFSVKVPIAQWSENVFVANTSPEFACNFSVTNANDAVSFQFGNTGCRFPNVSSTVKTKDVQFSRDLTANDLPVIEISTDSGANWGLLGQSGTSLVDLRHFQNTTSYGMDIDTVRVDARTVRVVFGEFRSSYSGGTFAGNAAPWSDIDDDPTAMWRIKIIQNSTTSGFENVAQSQPGLVAGAGQLLGTNTNDSPCVGCVGERIESVVLSTSPVALTSATSTDLTSITITPGHWNVCGHAFFVASSGSASSRTAVGISQVSATFDGDHAISYASLNSGPGFNLPSSLDAPCKVYKATTNTLLYFVVLSIYSGGYNEGSGHFYADRIR